MRAAGKTSNSPTRSRRVTDGRARPPDELPFELVSGEEARRTSRSILKVDNSTLADRVCQHLRHEILTNQLPPGTALHEARVAETLGVSRAPVRDAFRRLAAERLVQIVARRGAVVASLSLREFLDAYQLREALEVLAVRLATSRLGEADIAELRRLHRLMAREAARQDADAYFKANTAFHNLLVSRSGNRRLHETYTQLINEMRRYRMRSVALRGGLAQSNSEHEAIIKALEARDAERAARLLSDHIRVPQDALRSALDGGRVEPPRRRLSEGR